MIEALRRLEGDGRRDMGIWALGSIRSTGQEHRFEGSGYFDAPQTTCFETVL